MNKKPLKKEIAQFHVDHLKEAFNKIIKSYGGRNWKITYSVSVSAEPIAATERVSTEKEET